MVRRLQDTPGFTPNPVTEQAGGAAAEQSVEVSPPASTAPVSSTPQEVVPGEALSTPSGGVQASAPEESGLEVVAEATSGGLELLEASLDIVEPIDDLDVMAGFESTFSKNRFGDVTFDLSTPTEETKEVVSIDGYESVFSPRASKTNWSPAQSRTTNTPRTLSTATPPRATQVSAPSYIRYTNNNATRNRAISEPLQKSMSFLEGMGITMEVFSGGQPSKEEGGGRVGSTRHDHGHAADVFFYKDGRKLNYNNKQDLPILQEIIRQARRNGITGIGAGPGYMREGAFHIGFGTEAVWGAGGSRSNAPDWLVEAFYS